MAADIVTDKSQNLQNFERHSLAFNHDLQSFEKLFSSLFNNLFK